MVSRRASNKQQYNLLDLWRETAAECGGDRAESTIVDVFDVDEVGENEIVSFLENVSEARNGKIRSVEHGTS